jgi:hypothetical protein
MPENAVFAVVNDANLNGNLQLLPKLFKTLPESVKKATGKQLEHIVFMGNTFGSGMTPTETADFDRIVWQPLVKEYGQRKAEDAKLEEPKNGFLFGNKIRTPLDLGMYFSMCDPGHATMENFRDMIGVIDNGHVVKEGILMQRFEGNYKLFATNVKQAKEQGIDVKITGNTIFHDKYLLPEACIDWRAFELGGISVAGIGIEGPTKKIDGYETCVPVGKPEDVHDVPLWAYLLLPKLNEEFLSKFYADMKVARVIFTPTHSPDFKARLMGDIRYMAIASQRGALTTSELQALEAEYSPAKIICEVRPDLVRPAVDVFDIEGVKGVHTNFVWNPEREEFDNALDLKFSLASGPREKTSILPRRSELGSGDIPPPLPGETTAPADEKCSGIRTLSLESRVQELEREIKAAEKIEEQLEEERDDLTEKLKLAGTSYQQLLTLVEPVVDYIKTKFGGIIVNEGVSPILAEFAQRELWNKDAEQQQEYSALKERAAKLEADVQRLESGDKSEDPGKKNMRESLEELTDLIIAFEAEIKSAHPDEITASHAIPTLILKQYLSKKIAERDLAASTANSALQKRAAELNAENARLGQERDKEKAAYLEAASANGLLKREIVPLTAVIKGLSGGQVTAVDPFSILKQATPLVADGTIDLGGRKEIERLEARNAELVDSSLEEKRRLQAESLKLRNRYERAETRIKSLEEQLSKGLPADAEKQLREQIGEYEAKVARLGQDLAAAGARKTLAEGERDSKIEDLQKERDAAASKAGRINGLLDGFVKLVDDHIKNANPELYAELEKQTPIDRVNKGFAWINKSFRQMADSHTQALDEARRLTNEKAELENKVNAAGRELDAEKQKIQRGADAYSALVSSAVFAAAYVKLRFGDKITETAPLKVLAEFYSKGLKAGDEPDARDIDRKLGDLESKVSALEQERDRYKSQSEQNKTELEAERRTAEQQRTGYEARIENLLRDNSEALAAQRREAEQQLENELAEQRRIAEQSRRSALDEQARAHAETLEARRREYETELEHLRTAANPVNDERIRELESQKSDLEAQLRAAEQARDRAASGRENLEHQYRAQIAREREQHESAIADANRNTREASDRAERLERELQQRANEPDMNDIAAIVTQWVSGRAPARISTPPNRRYEAVLRGMLRGIENSGLSDDDKEVLGEAYRIMMQNTGYNQRIAGLRDHLVSNNQAYKKLITGRHLKNLATLTCAYLSRAGFANRSAENRREYNFLLGIIDNLSSYVLLSGEFDRRMEESDSAHSEELAQRDERISGLEADVDRISQDYSSAMRLCKKAFRLFYAAPADSRASYERAFKIAPFREAKKNIAANVAGIWYNKARDSKRTAQRTAAYEEALKWMKRAWRDESKEYIEDCKIELEQAS